MSIGPTNGPVDAGSSYAIGQNGSQRTPLPTPDGANPLTTQDIQQVCKSSPVSLDPQYAQHLADYVALDAMTKASLAAISKTLQMHGDLANLLGSGQ